MKNMKKIVLVALVALAFLGQKVTAQAIVGGGGVCYTSGNPNSVTSILNGFIQVNNCVNAYDTVNNLHYILNRAGTVGSSKWILLPTSAGSNNTAFNVSGGNLSLTDGGGTLTVPVTSIAPVQSVGVSGDITNTGTASAPVLNYVDGDKLATNEGALTVGAGTATTSIINSNTSGSIPVTLTAGAGITLSESGNTITIDNSSPNVVQTLSASGGTVTLSNGGGTFTIAGAGINTVSTAGSTITVTGTEVDGSVTNEIQTISASAASANSTTIAASLGGGSFTLSTTAPLSLTGAANAPVISLSSLPSYDNDAAAAAGGVAVGGWYKLTQTNTLGGKWGDVVTRAF